jgi:transposase
MRAFCLEYGIPIRQGVGAFKLDIARIVADEGNDLTPMMRAILKELWNEFTVADARLAAITRKLEAMAERLDAARRLMSIPGIGPLSATALVAAVGDGHQFSKARDLAAWLGLVPRQNSTGGKTILLGISKRGNSYLRRLIIHGARSCVGHMNRERDKLGSWLNQLEQRMHRNKVIVALANKMARMVWAVLTKPGNLYERVDPAHA